MHLKEKTAGTGRKFCRIPKRNKNAKTVADDGHLKGKYGRFLFFSRSAFYHYTQSLVLNQRKLRKGSRVLEPKVE